MKTQASLAESKLFSSVMRDGAVADRAGDNAADFTAFGRAVNLDPASAEAVSFVELSFIDEEELRSAGCLPCRPEDNVASGDFQEITETKIWVMLFSIDNNHLNTSVASAEFGSARG